MAPNYEYLDAADRMGSRHGRHNPVHARRRSPTLTGPVDWLLAIGSILFLAIITAACAAAIILVLISMFNALIRAL